MARLSDPTWSLTPSEQMLYDQLMGKRGRTGVIFAFDVSLPEDGAAPF